MKLSWILLLAVWLGFAPMYLGNKPFCFPNGNCYTVLLTNLTFTNASVSCGPKGSLATMKNEQEKNETLHFSAYLQNMRNMSKFWIGRYLPDKTCTVKGKEGFIWISGEDTTVTEQDIAHKRSCPQRKRCAALQSSGNSELRSLTWSWKPERCYNKLPSICRLSSDISPLEDMEITSPTPTAQPTMFMTSPVQTTETIPSTVNVICREFSENETNTCKVENIPYSCNDTHCFCGQLDDEEGGYGLRRCQEIFNESCLRQCIRSNNISCICGNYQISCEQADCTIIELPLSPMFHATTSSPTSDDENVFEKLIIPLILGLVALGILIMLIWGGVQMCVRKKKPKRKKSIIPVAEPEASDTDSTDNSSSDEEGESQDMAEMA